MMATMEAFLRNSTNSFIIDKLFEMYIASVTVNNWTLSWKKKDAASGFLSNKKGTKQVATNAWSVC